MLDLVILGGICVLLCQLSSRSKCCAVTSAHCKPTAIVQCENPTRTIASAGYVPLPSNSGGAGCRARGSCGPLAVPVLMNSDTLAFYRSQIFSRRPDYYGGR